MAAYSFVDVSAMLTGPTEVIDLGSGSANSEEGIVVTMTYAKNTLTIGADGDGMHTLHGGKSGTVTVSLIKASHVNKKLMIAYNAQSKSSALWGNNVIVIRNPVSGDIITVRSCAFQKIPDLQNAKEANVLSWVFDCIKIDALLGEFSWKLKLTVMSIEVKNSMCLTSLKVTQKLLPVLSGLTGELQKLR